VSEGLARRLKGAISGDVRINEPMSRHTTFRIGGPADLYVTCDTLADLGEVVRSCDEEGLQWTVAGKGSNLLVADGGYRGAVIVLGKEFKRHSVSESEIKAGAACILAYVVRDAFSRGLAGLEFAVGIPGTVGGALAMNAGTRDAWMGSIVESVTLYVPGRGLERVRGSDVSWSYRESGLGATGVIVETVLRLEESDRTRIREDMEASLSRRKRTQPLSSPSAGSVFRNPEGDSAGRLIEAAGLKGTTLGGARVSELHANFIVNDGGATAADVACLMRKIQMVVRDTYGIFLEPEIRFLGTFDAA
jgi:UDP-N-acetylmuramate dehydrogenase